MKKNLPLAVLTALFLSLAPALAHTPDHGDKPAPDAADLKSDSFVIGGPFSLLDQTGKRVTEADFKGKFMLVFFGFTDCPDICPTGLQTAANALGEMKPADAAQIQPVFISVDPARDTPAVLAEYVPQFMPGLVGLTGTDKEIAAAAKAYRVYYSNSVGQDGEKLVDHSAFLYLMGKDGKFINAYSADTEFEKLAVAISKDLR